MTKFARAPGFSSCLLTAVFVTTLAMLTPSAGSGQASVSDTAQGMLTEDYPFPELHIDELPMVTYRDSVDISGTALNAEIVRIRVGEGSEPVAEMEIPHSPEPSPFSARIGLTMGLNLIIAQAADALDSLSKPPDSLRVVRRDGSGRRPVLLRVAVQDSLPDGTPVPVRRSDTIRLKTWWTVPDAPASTADSLVVAADFSELDGNLGETDVVSLGGGTGAYLIVHQVSDSIVRPDGSGKRVPITAWGPDGFTNDTRLRFCLSNRPPLHLETRILDPKPAPYRMGDSIRIVTRWHSGDGLPMNVRADLSNILVDPDGVAQRITQAGDSTFLVRFRLPLSGDNLHEDGMNKAIPIGCGDAGCGFTVDRSLAIDLDTNPPPSEGLYLDPFPYEVTDRDSILVSGRAPEAAFAFILRDRTVRAEFVPDPRNDWRFEGKIALTVGRNSIQARSVDEAGNSTPLTAALIIYRAEVAALSVPVPYSRHDASGSAEDDIILLDPEGISTARIRIFTLEGDCVAESVASDPGQRYAWHWDGRGDDGRRASQGYYIVRGEWTDINGRRRQAVKGLLLKD